ncbi:MAG: hypothetical protein J6386_20720 [Candidatus Synoicihabitans palmerolidicus]|nr:hypothetical protein [Candidatus Synoicihabitans palmerolidicus]
MERFFRGLTVDCIRDGSFTSVRDLTNVIETYMERVLQAQEVGEEEVV